eukprot:TRINITY_DN114017_c0_g1_i1.p1 TRINITY_DN114017_c0_g1~~TRINITY_DN114017_c0_g1_i1.p1  ORF type:complete len:382 (-),score=94.56 TRINITY_DN114017_c0_g1_i1:9-1154(-)
MALRRRQQKLLGFGARWQDADPTAAIPREREVQQALKQLQEAYEQQRRLQDEGAAECAADYDAASRLALLTRRRGQAVESFGHREDGQWMLEQEEMLYLAERGSLAVFETEAGAGKEAADAEASQSSKVGASKKKRRLNMRELYGHVLSGPGSLAPDSYVVYSHLRRSGFTVQRPAETAEDACQKLWHLAVPSAPSAASEGGAVSAVHIVRPEEPVLASLLGRVATSERAAGEGADVLSSKLAEAPLAIAVADASCGSPAFLELSRPCLPGGRRMPSAAVAPCSTDSDSGAFATTGPAQSQVRDQLPSVENQKVATASSVGESSLPVRYAALRQRAAHLAAEGRQAAASAASTASKASGRRGGGVKRLGPGGNDEEDAWLL